MTEFAREQGESIRKDLERADGMGFVHLQTNLRAEITNTTSWVEVTSDLQRAIDEVWRETKTFLDEFTGQLGTYSKSPASEAQRQKAIQAASRYEDCLEAARPSGKAKALGV